jgi:hypothetical protein
MASSLAAGFRARLSRRSVPELQVARPAGDPGEQCRVGEGGRGEAGSEDGMDGIAADAGNPCGHLFVGRAEYRVQERVHRSFPA